ncbi:hypothetical protein AB0B85_13650 [Micromonospora sp. NPDC049044]|uniref:hypothetical protein n=1 Tax=Micromonospora sp. NPDC049044 TaxID=3154827 RepID=UPI0033E77CA4
MREGRDDDGSTRVCEEIKVAAATEAAGRAQRAGRAAPGAGPADDGAGTGSAGTPR